MPITNSSGRTVRLNAIEYRKDSTKTRAYLLLNKKQVSPVNLTNNDIIRLDIIAIDDSTNDTVYVKSFNQSQIISGSFVVNVQNSIDKLPSDFLTLPFLQIKAKDFKRTFKVSDPIDVKLKSREKIQGIVKSFDKETITVEDFDKKSIVIQRKELAGIKSCGPVWAIGGKISFIHNCNYTDLESVKFSKVKQVLVTKADKTSSYEWKE